MQELKLSKFLNKTDNFVKNVALEEDLYSIITTAGSTILLSKVEYEVLIATIREGQKL